MDDFAVDVCFVVEVAAAVAVGQAFVVQPEEVQNGRVQIVDVHFVFRSVVAVIISGSRSVAHPSPTARHPHGKPFRVMIPPVVVCAVGAAKFSPQITSVVQHAT